MLSALPPLRPRPSSRSPLSRFANGRQRRDDERDDHRSPPLAPGALSERPAAGGGGAARGSKARADGTAEHVSGAPSAHRRHDLPLALHAEASVRGGGGAGGGRARQRRRRRRGRGRRRGGRLARRLRDFQRVHRLGGAGGGVVTDTARRRARDVIPGAGLRHQPGRQHLPLRASPRHGSPGARGGLRGGTRRPQLDARLRGAAGGGEVPRAVRAGRRAGRRARAARALRGGRGRRAAGGAGEAGRAAGAARGGVAGGRGGRRVPAGRGGLRGRAPVLHWGRVRGGAACAGEDLGSRGQPHAACVVGDVLHRQHRGLSPPVPPSPPSLCLHRQHRGSAVRPPRTGPLSLCLHRQH
jgi:hypothetical protein